MSLMIYFGAKKMTYNLRFSIASSAAFGTPLTIVLSTARSLFAVSSRRCPSSSLLSPTAWYNSQPMLKIEITTHIFYFDDHFSNWECYLDWIGIDTTRHLLEECLRKPWSYYKTVFSNCLPICLRLRIRFYNSSVMAVLLKTCSTSVF